MKTLVDSSRLFPGVDSPYLDCVADNLAILLLHAGAEEARSPFACQWRFAFDPQRVDWLGVLFETPYPELVEHQTGCRIVRGSVDPEDSLEALRPLVEAGRPVLMFGDVYHMPWLPYFGRVHQEHSFLIDGVSEDGRMVHIVDAYDNATEWGRALPIACELPVTALPVILDLESENAKTYWVLERVEEEAPSIDLEALLSENARQMLAAIEERRPEAFVERYRTQMPDVEAARELVLGLWFISRARALHGLWLQDVQAQAPHLLPEGYPDLYQQEVVVPWRRMSEQAYLLLRRALLGRAVPETCFQMIEETVAPGERKAAEALQQHLNLNR